MTPMIGGGNGCDAGGMAPLTGLERAS